MLKLSFFHLPAHCAMVSRPTIHIHNLHQLNIRRTHLLLANIAVMQISLQLSSNKYHARVGQQLYAKCNHRIKFIVAVQVQVPLRFSIVSFHHLAALVAVNLLQALDAQFLVFCCKGERLLVL